MITLTSAVTCGFPDTPGNVVNWFKTCPLSLNSQRENNATRESRKSVKQFSFLWSASPLEGSRVHGPSLSLSYPPHPGAPHPPCASLSPAHRPSHSERLNGFFRKGAVSHFENTATFYFLRNIPKIQSRVESDIHPYPRI